MGTQDGHFVVSIGCEYACGGTAIGKAVAQDLGIPCYDRQIVDQIMERTGVSPAILKLADQGVDISGLRAERGYASAPTKYTDLTERMVYLQKEIIKKLADRSSCVIIGRCSDYILRKRTDTINIFIYAPTEVRLHTVMNELHVERVTAEKLMQENDDNLHARYLQITGTDWGERHHRQMLIDSSVLGVQGTADYIEILINAFRKKIYGEDMGV